MVWLGGTNGWSQTKLISPRYLKNNKITSENKYIVNVVTQPFRYGEHYTKERRQKKPKSNGPVRERGESASPIFFFFRKEKNMQNVLKQKSMYFYETCEICSFGPFFCLFYYSESFDMHIEK